MDRSQSTGAIIIAVAAVQLVLFFYGLARRSYLALAIPVTAAVTGLAVLSMWVGWTMMTTETDMPEPELEEAPDAR